MNDFFDDDPWADPPKGNSTPFATDTVITKDTPVPGESTTNEGRMSMGTNEVNVTLKGDGGYDQPWIVIKAPNVSALESELKALKDSGINGLVKELTDAYASVVGRGNEKWEPKSNNPASRGHSKGGGYSRPAAQSAPPAQQSGNPGDKTCVHGPMIHRSGGGGDTGKKPWSGYFCPTPKGTPDQCSPVWGR